MTNYACNTPCKYCKVTGKCARLTTEVDNFNYNCTPVEPFYPNREPDTVLRCGCSIAWPVIRVFAGDLKGQILCSEHGYQPQLTKKQIESARKKKIKTGQTFDDIPQF